MKIVETTATLTADGTFTAKVADLAPGTYRVTLHIEDPPISTTPPKFSDTENHWAKPFIEALAAQGIISGFPDGTFKPNQTVNRAQFAAILTSAFKLADKRQPIQFTDIADNYWAAPAIKKAYATGFISGYPNQQFRPLAGITKAHALIALVNGLELQLPDVSQIDLSQLYQDWASIPTYARGQTAIASGKGMVVNYPNLKQLEPNRSATRAEIAALIYQALVQAGRAAKIASPYIVPPPVIATVTVAHQREFRGVWTTTLWNVDWPSKSGLTTQQAQQELLQIIDRVKSLNLNAFFLQIRPEGDAFYASQLEPWSHWLTGTQGKAPDPLWDPLQFAINECHKRNIEFHAWLNPYRAKTNSHSAPNASSHFMVEHPEAVYKYGTEHWMDPGSKLAQDNTYNVILDIVRRYDLDGIHIDDYFYPYPVQNETFPDSATYQAYKDNGGSLGLEDWRRENVNQIIQRLQQGIHSLKPHVKFGIAPFGIYRPGEPPGIVGLDQYGVLFADPKKWLAEGWLDYIAPQLYWRIDQTQQSYPVLLKWWTDNNPNDIQIYIGNNLQKLGESSWTLEEFEKQVKLTRESRAKLALGNIFYNMQVFKNDRAGVNTFFQQNIYPQPALVPVISSLTATPPALPTGLKVSNRTLSWNAPSNSNLRAWTLYRQESTGWKLAQILPTTTTQTSVQPGTYALCAVNRIARESEGVTIVVS
ncbi:glycoside hydrolase family 10 protein [Lusitaniella coriacea]|uniref:glycoside hydrolase family 10 protein n=1 Tax=Lusitaniella coriacea TaxID=1983105 RepID=UPI003CE7D37E